MSREDDINGVIMVMIIAGRPGMMSVYACNETDNYMPVTLDGNNLIMSTLFVIRKEGKHMFHSDRIPKARWSSDDNILNVLIR